MAYYGSMRWRLAIGVAVLGSTGVTQEETKDPVQLLREMRTAPPAKAGTLITIRDGATKQPIPGAFVVCLSSIHSPEMDDVRARFAEVYTQVMHRGIAFAAQTGQKWCTNEKGQARVSSRYGYAFFGDKLGVFNASSRIVDLLPRRFVEVEVLEHDGSPCAGEKVCLGSKGNVRDSVRTDRTGKARIELPHASPTPYIRMGGRIYSEYQIPRVPIQPNHTRGVPIRIKLPPLARVRILSKRFTNHQREISHSWIDRFTNIQEGPQEYRVPFDSLLRVAVEFKHHCGREHLVVRAPGSDAKITTATVQGRGFKLLLTMQLRRNKIPIRSTNITLNRGNSQTTWPGASTDRNGRIWIGLTSDQLDAGDHTIHALDGWHYGAGAVTLQLAELKPGVHDLGRIELKREPITLRGTVVDENGKPIHSAEVLRDHGGPFTIPHDHALTDLEGRFTMRKLELETVEKVGLTVSAKGFERMTEPQFFPYGSKDARIVLRREKK